MTTEEAVEIVLRGIGAKDFKPCSPCRFELSRIRDCSNGLSYIFDVPLCPWCWNQGLVLSPSVCEARRQLGLSAVDDAPNKHWSWDRAELQRWWADSPHEYKNIARFFWVYTATVRTTCAREVQQCREDPARQIICTLRRPNAVADFTAFALVRVNAERW